MAIAHIPRAALERNRSGHLFAPTIPPCDCKHCGKTYRPKRKDRTSFCSSECAYGYRKAHVLTVEQKRERLKLRAKAKAKGPFHLVCSVCAAPFVSVQTTRKYCSRACYNATFHRPKVNCHCKDCGVAITGTKAKTYCRRCFGKRRKLLSPSNPRVRANRFGVAYQPISPLKVFERDAWRCQICGCRTPKAQRGKPSPNAPEIDHRIPMSKGGPHTWENVQCACRQCNMAKGNRTSAGQIPLFAMPT